MNTLLFYYKPRFSAESQVFWKPWFTSVNPGLQEKNPTFNRNPAFQQKALVYKRKNLFFHRSPGFSVRKPLHADLYPCSLPYVPLLKTISPSRLENALCTPPTPRQVGRIASCQRRLYLQRTPGVPCVDSR